MRFFAYLAAVAVLFAIANRSAAQVIDPRSPPPASAHAAGLRMLTWPGKTPVAAPARPAAPLAPRPPAPAAPAQPTAALPTSIYAAPPPARAAAAPLAPTRALAMAAPQATGGPASPRFYSLHRAYGETPDSIPLTPQFFATDSPDLARPPPPVARQVMTDSGRVVRAAPTGSDPATAN